MKIIKTARTCNRCGLLKQMGEFYTDPTKTGGHTYTCKSCMRFKSRKRYKKHKAERIQQVSEYNREHAEELKQYRHEYYLKHRKKD